MKQLKTRFIRHYHRAKVASGVMSWHGGMPGMACHFVPLWHGNLRVPGTLVMGYHGEYCHDFNNPSVCRIQASSIPANREFINLPLFHKGWKGKEIPSWISTVNLTKMILLASYLTGFDSILAIFLFSDDHSKSCKKEMCLNGMRRLGACCWSLSSSYVWQ